MTRTLPKGHVSCLSNAFRYTPAADTNVAKTFARINRELTVRDACCLGMREPIERQPVRRPFSIETVESARRLLRAGGLRLTPDLVHL